MIASTSNIQSSVLVNEDGQIVLKTGRLSTEQCSHTFDPLVISRAMSLAIAKAVIAAQEGGSP
jgi:hypothetical protein